MKSGPRVPGITQVFAELVLALPVNTGMYLIYGVGFYSVYTAYKMVPLSTSFYTCVELRLSRLRDFSKVTGEAGSRARN